jgi:hypothetical protein
MTEFVCRGTSLCGDSEQCKNTYRSSCLSFFDSLWCPPFYLLLGHHYNICTHAIVVAVSVAPSSRARCNWDSCCNIKPASIDSSSPSFSFTTTLNDLRCRPVHSHTMFSLEMLRARFLTNILLYAWTGICLLKPQRQLPFFTLKSFGSPHDTWSQLRLKQEWHCSNYNRTQNPGKNRETPLVLSIHQHMLCERLFV